MKKPYRIGYTTGVFDLFHVGHLNILKRAKDYCDYLIVGVSTDELVESEKHKHPVIPYNERVEIVRAIKYVDDVVPQENKDKFAAYMKLKFDAMFVGNDWQGTPQWKLYEQQLQPYGVDIIYFPRTEGTSSTIITQYINQTLKNE